MPADSNRQKRPDRVIHSSNQPVFGTAVLAIPGIALHAEILDNFFQIKRQTHGTGRAIHVLPRIAQSALRRIGRRMTGIFSIADDPLSKAEKTAAFGKPFLRRQANVAVGAAKIFEKCLVHSARKFDPSR